LSLALEGNPEGKTSWEDTMATDRYDDTTKPRSGVSLAKGPVALVGLASLALGVLGFIFASRSFDFDAPRGTVTGTTFIGIAGNGWTWVAFAAAGLLLLLGSPIHWGAKSMAFIVGVAFVVGALIALSDGDDILGVIAMNDWTTLVMGAAGVALIVLSMLPRVGRRRGGAPMATRRDRELEEPRTGRFHRDREPVAEREPVTAGDTVPADERATTRHDTLDERSRTDRGVLDERR
jgi:hypothetical protein